MYATGWSTIASRVNKTWMRCLAHWRATAGKEHGVAALETAFIAMFVFVLIAGVIDLGGAYHDYIIAINSSREGARMYSRIPCTSSTRASMKAEVVAAARGEATNSGLAIVAANVSLAPDGRCPAANETVRVTVQVDYQTMLGQFWGATTFPIRARTSMMFYGAD